MIQGVGMDRHLFKVYCAGPLFNPKEREEMDSIASALKDAGYLVFLPQENGLEFAKLLPVFVERDIALEDAIKILNMAIFSLDVFEIIDSQGLVLNMNGRVPDEGAMVEAGIAWAHDKSLVIFKNDDRSLIQGNCNPLVTGLSDFEIISEYQDIPTAFDRKISQSNGNISFETTPRFETAKNKGSQISEYLIEQKKTDEITELLIKLFAEETCPYTKGKNQNVTPENMQL